jgi:hypothetical protein
VSPVDWEDVANWGKPGRNVHVASNGSDVGDSHDVSEQAAERGRG